MKLPYKVMSSAALSVVVASIPVIVHAQAGDFYNQTKQLKYSQSDLRSNATLANKLQDEMDNGDTIIKEVTTGQYLDYVKANDAFINIIANGGDTNTALTEAITAGATSATSDELNGYTPATPDEETLAVSSVSAINAKALKVTFSKAPTDVSKITFDVKRGTTAVVLTPTWNDSSTEATLTSSTNLVAGDYTVTVAGDTFEAGKNTGSVTVAAQKIGKIEFVGTSLAKTDTDKGTIGFKVYDQYDTDVTATATTLVNNIQWTASIATDSLNDTNGILTVDATTAFTDKQQFVITAIDPATGTSKSATVTVGDAAAVKTVTLGENVLPTGKTRIYTGAATAVTLPITGVDQYGNTLDTAAKLGGLTLLSSDTLVVPSLTDVNNKAAINVNTSGLTTPKNVVITIVINATGETITKTLEIVEPAKADTITLGTIEKSVIADTDAAGVLVLPITATNQFGETLTAKDIADQFTAGNISVTETGSLEHANLQVETNSSSANYGKIVNKAAIGTTSGDAVGVGTIVVTTSTGKTVSLNVTTKEARKVTEILAPTKATTNLVAGATSSFTYNYKDQYGDTIIPAAGNRNSDLTYKFVVTDLTGDAGAVTVNKTTGADEDAIGTVTVSATAGKTGTAKVAAQLLNSSNEVVSQIETTFSVTANNASGLTYSVADVPTLFGDSAAAQGITGADADARPITITATDGTNTYAVPDSQIVSITSVTPGVVVSNGQLGDVTLDAQDNKWVIGADDTDTITFASGSNTASATIRVTINTTDGLKTLDKQVTVSKEAKKTVELKITDTDLSAANPYEIPTNANELNSFTFDNRTGAETGTAAFLLAKDQYGVWTKITKDGTNVILNTNTLATPNIDADNGFEFTSDKFILEEAANAQETANIRYKADTNLTYSVMDGDAIKQFTVKVIEEEAPATVVESGTAGTVNSGKIATTETSVFTFDEELSEASKAKLLTVFKEKFDAIKGTDGWADTATATSGSAVWSAPSGKSVLTITPFSGISANTVDIPAAFTINKVDVVDVIGNAAGTSGTITVTPASN